MSADFDPGFAANLIGCTLLVGISYFTAGGEFQDAAQFWGVVEVCDAENGVMVRLSDNAERWLPPCTSAIEPASPGEYRLKGSGEVVVNPDFIATFSVTAPD